MKTEKAAESLRALARGENRSKMGRLRGLMPDIENAQAAGVSLAKILEALNANGMDMKMQSFKSMLYRIRKKREESPTASTAELALKNEVIVGAPEAQQAAETAKDALAFAGTKVGEPKRFIWDPQNTEKPEW